MNFDKKLSASLLSILAIIGSMFSMLSCAQAKNPFKNFLLKNGLQSKNIDYIILDLENFFNNTYKIKSDKNLTLIDDLISSLVEAKLSQEPPIYVLMDKLVFYLKNGKRCELLLHFTPERDAVWFIIDNSYYRCISPRFIDLIKNIIEHEIGVKIQGNQ